MHALSDPLFCRVKPSPSPFYYKEKSLKHFKLLAREKFTKLEHLAIMKVLEF